VAIVIEMRPISRDGVLSQGDDKVDLSMCQDRGLPDHTTPADRCNDGCPYFVSNATNEISIK